MSRLRRLVLADRYFFVTCNLLRTRAVLNEDDFEVLVRVMQARREEHGFLLTAWVFLPDHWHAILGPRYLKGLSRVTSDGGLILVRELDQRLGGGILPWPKQVARTCRSGPRLFAVNGGTNRRPPKQVCAIGF
jgi:hypothetical protein